MIDSSRTNVDLPALSGPHAVARVEYEWTDPTRTNEIGPHPDDPRRLKVEVFLPPPTRHRGAQPRAYFSHVSESRFIAGSLIMLSTDLLEYAQGHAVGEAPVASLGGALPLLIFSPGFNIPTAMQAAIVADVASHGFAVAAIHHPYVQSVVSFRDGTVIKEVEQDLSPTGTEKIESVLVADIQFVRDQVEGLSESDLLFAGAIDLARVGVFGFSSGGDRSDQGVQSGCAVSRGHEHRWWDHPCHRAGGNRPAVLVGQREQRARSQRPERPPADVPRQRPWRRLQPDDSHGGAPELLRFSPVAAAISLRRSQRNGAGDRTDRASPNLRDPESVHRCVLQHPCRRRPGFAAPTTNPRSPTQYSTRPAMMSGRREWLLSPSW